jgi:hypothetical protein
MKILSEEFPGVMDDKGVGHSAYTSTNEEHTNSGECILLLNCGYFIFPAQISNKVTKMYKFVSLFVIFRDVGIGVTLREEHSFRMFENMWLWEIFAPEGEEILGGWKELYNEERSSLHPFIYGCTNLCCIFGRYFSFLTLY